MMEGNVESLRQKFEQMSYQELKKTAKENAIKAVGKKTELIKKLVEKLHLDDKNQEDTEMEFEDNNNIQNNHFEKDLSNQQLVFEDDDMDARSDTTYTIEKQGRSNSVEHDFPSNRRRSKSCGNYRRATSKSPGRIKEYFAMKHQELDNHFEDIESSENRLKQRHRKLTEGVSPRILALSQPKCTKFNEPQDPSKMCFKFGEVAVENIASIQKSPGKLPFTPPRLYRSKPVMDLQQCAKTLSKDRVVSSTGRALLTPRLAELAKPKCSNITPKATRRSTSIGRTRYTPKLKPYNYVDTTKMTDEQFEEFKQQQSLK